MFFNILHGGEERIFKIKSYIEDQKVTFLAMSELNHWKKEDLQKFGDELGLSYTLFLSTKHGYHLGVASYYPLILISKENDSFWHHGYIYVHVKQLNVGIFVTHLSPHNLIVRRWEASQILEIWQDTIPHVPLLVFGDLNTLSPIDAIKHTHLPNIFMESTQLSSKFLNREMEIDYSPMNILLSKLSDTLLNIRFEVDEERSSTSVPTGLTEDYMHAAPMRLDYALSSEINTYFSWIHKTEKTWSLSDHLPLIVQKCTSDFPEDGEKKIGL